jgi:hypothetical protein
MKGSMFYESNFRRSLHEQITLNINERNYKREDGMKRSSFCKNIFYSNVLFFLIPFSVFSQEASEKTRIGTFDSRCVAIAYGRTDFLKDIGDLRKEHDKARAEGNEERVKELEKLGPNLQFIMHQQCFSTGSVINIMEKIKDKLPQIAQKNNVKIILSKWELFYDDGSLEIVDITDDIVNLFDLDEQSRNIVQNIKKMEPVPIEQISNDPNE